MKPLIGAAGFLLPGIHPRTSAIASIGMQAQEERQGLNTRQQQSRPASANPPTQFVSEKPDFALLTASGGQLAERQAARKTSPETTLRRDMSCSLPNVFRWIPSNGLVAVDQQRLPAWHHRGSANSVWKSLAVDPVTVALDCSRPFASLLQLVLNTFHGRAVDFSALRALPTHLVSQSCQDLLQLPVNTLSVAQAHQLRALLKGQLLFESQAQ